MKVVKYWIVSKETNKDVCMYIEEFILKDVVILLYKYEVI